MLARDDTDSPAQVLHPNNGSLQRLAPTAGNAVRVGTAFAARTKVVGVRVRSFTGVGHVRFGDGAVAAEVTDFPLTFEDGWMFFSLAGKATDGSLKTVTHVSVFAETATVNADIVEMH